MSYPFGITLEPTDRCNLQCPECPSGSRGLSRPIGQMELSLFEKVIDETAPFAFYLMLYFQGEPYLHPDFFNMVKIAKQRRFYVITSTNGHFLTPDNTRKTAESGLDKIIISLDGTTQDVYETYRKGGQLDKVIEGITNLTAVKKEHRSKTPVIELQYLVFRFNEQQMKEAKRLAKQLGVDKLKFKTAQLYHYERKGELLPSNTKYSRYILNPDKTLTIKNKLRNRCQRLWTTGVITWEGNVVPCCYDKDARYVMGNTCASSFKEIWNNKEYKDFRKAILLRRKDIPICTNCR